MRKSKGCCLARCLWILALGGFANAHANSVCEILLVPNSRVKNAALREIQFYAINGAMITGANFYPVEFIIGNLGLTPGLGSLEGLSVVSVGEGYSGFLPYALSKNIEIIAVDPAYPRPGQEMSEFADALPRPQGYAHLQANPLLKYINAYRPYLRHGNAQNLPLDDKSVDVLLSHKIANHTALNNGFTALDGIRFVEEGLRVARKEIRINGFGQDHVRTMTRYLEAKYPGLISIESKEILLRASVNRQGQRPRKPPDHREDTLGEPGGR
jgi:hypothetical protein